MSKNTGSIYEKHREIDEKTVSFQSLHTACTALCASLSRRYAQHSILQNNGLKPYIDGEEGPRGPYLFEGRGAAAGALFYYGPGGPSPLPPYLDLTKVKVVSGPPKFKKRA